MMGGGLLFLLLIAGAIAYALGWRPEFLNNVGTPQRRESTLDILQRRYAQGEITKEEYEQMRRDLGA